MGAFQVGIIGCGGRGRAHAWGYAYSPEAEIVACADPKEENAQALAQRHGIPRIYSDYREMLEKESLDIVSVCTWTGLHTEMILAAAESGVKAINAEKPMAPTWGEAKKQHEVCTQRGVQLTFSHQRRFALPFHRAKQLLDEGAIGRPLHIEGYCPNLFDWGTHWFDMFCFFNNDEPAEWVMGQIDATGSRQVFGVPVEGAGLSWIRWKNGLQGLIVTGHAGHFGASNLIRVIGTQGLLEVGEGYGLRLLQEGHPWQTPDVQAVPFYEEWQRIAGWLKAQGPEVRGDIATILSILDSIQCLKTGQEPLLSSRRALQATELIFATYESSRRRAKVVLPLEVEDSAFLTMLQEDLLPVTPR